MPGHPTLSLLKSWPGPSAENCRGFLLYKMWRILSGIFLEDFSGHFCPQKREKIQRQMWQSTTWAIWPGRLCSMRHSLVGFACWWTRPPTSWFLLRVHPWQSASRTTSCETRNGLLLAQLRATNGSGQDKRHLWGGLWLDVKQCPCLQGWSARLSCDGCARQSRPCLSQQTKAPCVELFCPGHPRAGVRDIPTPGWVPSVSGISCPKTLSLGQERGTYVGHPQTCVYPDVCLGRSCTRLRVPPVALHVSRYTCRSWFPGF